MKKLTCTSLILIIFLGSICTLFVNSFNVGDVNNDGSCDVLDCFLLERQTSGRNCLTEDGISKADLNGDGNISILDFRLLVQSVLDVTPYLSVENDNTIILSGLPADKYTLKYETDNGVIMNYADICTLEITEDISEVTYKGFINENCAPVSATSIGVYNSCSEKVGEIALSTLDFSSLGEKQYSFAAISDTHIGAKTAESDLINALKYFSSDEQIDFTTICGDLTLGGSETNLNLYKSIVDNYATSPVYAISGNHETNASFAPLAMDSLKPYTDQDLYYSFTKNDDVYIMMGMYDVHAGYEFAEGELQWLYEILETNRNKRCFLFMHLYPRDGSGDAVDLDLEGDMLNNTQGKVFYSLLSHYSNVIYFHGHSHEEFEIQEYNGMNNYDNSFGCHSIHIPSLAYPKYISNGKLIADYDASQGYIVDVYEDNILLRGRDFITGEFLPVATYSLDTTIKDIEENTYYDPTGTIVNDNSNVLLSGGTWYKGSVDKNTITKISIVDNYTETDFDEYWDASISNNEQILVYRTGTELTIVGSDNGTVANSNSAEIFAGFKNLTQIIGLEKLNTANITDLNGMFKNCNKLTTVNLNNFTDVKPVNMMNVFSGCGSLKTVDLSNFDLSNVNKYTNLFYNCNSLENVKFCDNASVDQASVYCYNMFGNCSSLRSFDMSVFSGKNLNLGSTFSGCSSLENVTFGDNKLLAFNTTFTNCTQLKELDISGFDSSNVDNMNKVFEGCESLCVLVLPENFNTTKVKTMRSMFSGCSSLTLDCSGWDTTSLIDITSFNLDAPNITSPVLISA